jgi:hypothetical protein
LIRQAPHVLLLLDPEIVFQLRKPRRARLDRLAQHLRGVLGSLDLTLRVLLDEHVSDSIGDALRARRLGVRISQDEAVEPLR